MESLSKHHAYVAIDLKSFYASCEARERGLDPLTTNLVVADESRTEKTICLAVSPSLKAWGISGRARLFEVVQKIREVNARRRQYAPGRQFSGKSWSDTELKRNPALEVDYIVAAPQMALYMKRSTEIYAIYLKYVAPEDIFAYSIDEVFIDLTHYLDAYRLSAHDLTRRMIQDRRELEAISICVKLQWTSGQSTSRRIGMAFVLRNWMKCHTAVCCGLTVH